MLLRCSAAATRNPNPRRFLVRQGPCVATAASTWLVDDILERHCLHHHHQRRTLSLFPSNNHHHHQRLHRTISRQSPTQQQPAPPIQQRRWMITKRQKRALEQNSVPLRVENSGEEQSSTPPSPSPASASASASAAKTATTSTSTSNNPPVSLVRTTLPPEWGQPLWLPNNNTPQSQPDNTSQSAGVYVDYKQLYDPELHLPSAPQDWTGYEPSTQLWEELAAQIGVLGRPMTIADFMRHALLHPLHGYYSRPSRQDNDDDFDADEWDVTTSTTTTNSSDNPIFGPRGDFVTAPEICQVFGESIAVWWVTQWKGMSSPPPADIQWVEMGPGRGTLMSDMVRFAMHPQLRDNFGRAIKLIHLIEPSLPLRAQQQQTLQEQCGQLVDWEFCNNRIGGDESTIADSGSGGSSEGPSSADKPKIQVHWHDSFGALSAKIMQQKHKPHDRKLNWSSMPLFVACQEFFDALPVHAFEKTKQGVWRERMVDMAIRDDVQVLEDDKGESTETAIANTDAEKSLQNHKRPRLRIVLAPEVTPALKTLMNVDEEGHLLDAALDAKSPVGQVVEVCPEGILLVQDMAAWLELQGGAALLVDYGEEGSTDSLRGFYKHKQTHFLSLPGQVDVTADVDFTALKHAVTYRNTTNKSESTRTMPPPSGLPHETDSQENEMSPSSSPPEKKAIIKAYGPIPQGKFLVSMGAQERVIQAIEDDSTTEQQAEDLYRALERLVTPEQMGLRYKVLAIAQERTCRDGSFTVRPAGF